MYLFRQNLKKISFMTQMMLGRIFVILVTLAVWSNSIWADFMLFGKETSSLSLMQYIEVFAHSKILIISCCLSLSKFHLDFVGRLY